jgi:hypothetical protein
VIGRISMDLVTIDVTEVPEALSETGAVVEILGPHMTADDLADHARTNAYEVMTALGRRLPASMSNSRRVTGDRAGDIPVSIPAGHPARPHGLSPSSRRSARLRVSFALQAAR